jgi:hypothetical protein
VIRILLCRVVRLNFISIEIRKLYRNLDCFFLYKVKDKGKASPVAKSVSPVNKKSTNGVRNLKSNSPDSSRSRTRTRSYSSSRSRSRSSSRTSSKSLDTAQNKKNLNAEVKIQTKTVMTRQPVFNSVSADRKRASESKMKKF